VTLTLDAGPYLVGSPSLATMTIANQELPAAPTNVWVATGAGDAGTSGNWSLGHSPTNGEIVYLLGEVSTANLTWGASASATVGGWIQDADYTGTVTIETVYPDAGRVRSPTCISPGTA
jgi:hypothetical protein